ncbi:unnamed protein product [Prunus brigantina]
MKTVNSTVKPIDGVARGVELQIATWKGMADFFVISIDGYDVVLGMEFMDKSGAMPCIVPMVRQQGESKLLSAMQFSKSWKKGEPTLLATMKMDTVAKKVQPVPKAVEIVLKEFVDVMPKGLPKTLPPRREVDHATELEPGAKPPAKASYQMAPPELEKLRRQLKQLLNLGRARYFTKLDIRSRYYQVRITPGDEPKTACVSRYGFYEFLVMPFGMTNDLATFCILMSKVFHPFLDKFVMVYSNDMVVYNNSLEEHLKHLHKFFQHVFHELKRALMEELGLRLPDLSKPFEVHTHVSDFAIGGALMQDGHLLAFESRKLNDTKRRIYVPRWDNLR